jgi:hypothetical protein
MNGKNDPQITRISQRGRAATKNREGAMARRSDAKKNFLATKNTADTENLFWILEFGFWICFEFETFEKPHHLNNQPHWRYRQGRIFPGLEGFSKVSFRISNLLSSCLRGEKSSWRSWRLGGSIVSVADAPEIFAGREEVSGLWHRFRNKICVICEICGSLDFCH